jgi:hypothetical protein
MPGAGGGVTGNDLLSTLRLQAEYIEYYRTIPPTSCPNDGEPLRGGPPSEPGILFCPFDGWQYPRDYDPNSMAGM